MAKRIASLGKGLDALLPSSFSIEPPKEPLIVDDGQSVGVTAMIELDKIRPNRMQPRETFDPVAMEDLKKSIKEKGVIQPITVRRIEGGYEIIAGERRVRASTQIGLEKIPAYILDIETDAEMLELALIENVQRDNLNPIEVALGYKRLMQECDLTQEEVSKKVGKDRTTVTNFLRLLKLPDEIQRSLRLKSLSMGHARAILSLSEDWAQREVFQQVRDNELSVRKTEELVKKVESGLSVHDAVLEALEKKSTSRSDNAANTTTSQPGVPHPSHPLPSISTEGFVIPDDLKPEFQSVEAPADIIASHNGLQEAGSDENSAVHAQIMSMESQLRHILATQVRIKTRSNSTGIIEIEYFSPDELERLMELFTIIEREQYT